MDMQNLALFHPVAHPEELPQQRIVGIPLRVIRELALSPSHQIHRTTSLTPTPFPHPRPLSFFDPSDLPIPSDSPPTVPERDEPPVTPVRNSTARVSFREPISCSYSVEEDDWEEEESVEANGPKEDEEQEDDGDEAVGSLGHRLRFCNGGSSQMDLLDGSYHRRFRHGGHSGTEKRVRHSRGSRNDRPRLDILESREGEFGHRFNSVRDGRTYGSLTLQSTRCRHEESCSTCSSSSESEEEGFFMGERIPLPPQLTGEQKVSDEQRQEAKKSRTGSFRRRRTQSLSTKEKENCILS